MLFGGQCNEAILMYKATCMIDLKHFIDKTQNDTKTKISKHITNVGKFWSKQQHLNHTVGLELEDIIDNARSAASAPAVLTTALSTNNTPRSTRSFSHSRRIRALARSQNLTPQSANQTAMNNLLVFSPNNYNLQPLLHPSARPTSTIQQVQCQWMNSQR